MRRDREAGFTLIEILIAVSIVGVIFSFILSVLTSSIAQSREAGNRMDIDHVGRFFIQKISAELTCATLLATSGRGALVGRHYNKNGKARDEIHFTSFSQSYFTGRPRSGISEISYFFRYGNDGVERLARREADTVDDPVDAGGEIYDLTPLVEELSIKYKKGAAWETAWDSRDLKTLPEEISVELRLLEKNRSYLYTAVLRPQA